MRRRLEVEDVTPTPEHFVKSISEQGYRLETAIADLIDNSISAGADMVEVLLDTESRPFTLFIADNGRGMTEDELRGAMRFPSRSLEETRAKSDLGRFGLGLKTASFSQTRCFSVLSRDLNSADFKGRTWDVAVLREHGWKLKVESSDEVAALLHHYRLVSDSLLGGFSSAFHPRTVVVWKGLHKFESYIENRNCADVLKAELSGTTRAYLSLVFHKFMERSTKPLKIRLNNSEVTSFNPFPTDSAGVRRLSGKNRKFGKDTIIVQGFVLPISSVDDVKNGSNRWVPPGKNLMDLEGIYIYRGERIILFGGWLGLAGRSPRMQLARLRVELGNAVDHLLHLNVAKSQVELPYDLREGFAEYVSDLRAEAEKEYLNRTIRSFRGPNETHEALIKTSATNKGAQMMINPSFPLVGALQKSLSDKQALLVKAIFRMINKELNSIRKVHEDIVFSEVNGEVNISKQEFLDIISGLLDEGWSKEFVRSQVIEKFGYDVGSLPDEVRKLIQ